MTPFSYSKATPTPANAPVNILRHVVLSNFIKYCKQESIAIGKIISVVRIAEEFTFVSEQMVKARMNAVQR